MQGSKLDGTISLTMLASNAVSLLLQIIDDARVSKTEVECELNVNRHAATSGQWHCKIILEAQEIARPGN